MKVLASTLCFVFLTVVVNADTPANCTYEDVVGKWVFSIGKGGQTNEIKCSSFSGPAVNKIKVELLYPDVAVDQFNNKGFWTLIYNQGFEVVIAGRKYFAFSKYVNQTSYCHQTLAGWSHDILGRDWACYTGEKSQEVKKVLKQPRFELGNILQFSHGINTPDMVEHINRVQKSWTAVRYPQFEGLGLDDFINMAGGKASKIYSRPHAAPVTGEQKMRMMALPQDFDWRNVDGVNYVSPIRNQGGCGSCYAFASLGMAESRVRIQTNNTQKPVFSPQDIVDCSEYSQGCAGGFPYLIGGKYAEDFGLVLETCNPYTGKDGPCFTDPKCAKHYFTDYHYVGGYYGGCNELAMMNAIYTQGPIAVAFEVYKDFMSYKSGIYRHTTDQGLGFNPFEITNHAVLAVGWGEDSGTGEKYWIVKNSWGLEWGMNGYFWISRGNNECSIESIAVAASPVITFDSN